MMLIVFTVICWMVLIAKSHAASICKTEVAHVVSMQGIIEIRRAQENAWQQASMDIVLCTGDMIRARAQSRAALRLSNDSMLRLDQKTSITFPQLEDEKGTSLLDLLEGAIHIITRTPKPFKIRTPFANASVEGTEFFVGLHKDNTRIVVYEGKVSASNAQGSLILNDHEAAVAFKDQAPRKEIIIHPTDAVQWALYYPVILDYWQSKGNSNSTGDLIRKASHLLTVGQVEEAKEIIRQALQLEGDHSDAYALLAIITVVQNEKDQALELADKAVTSNQYSTAAHLALSYVQQAQFDIELALENVQKVVVLDERNALAWARLAELQMSVGYLDRALDAAQHAVSLRPDLGKTQTVLGFAHLLQIDTQTAQKAFHRAIALDQADPMPRLGLGIALIREGNLEAGRIELEIAASLDPANSLIRSYLGKAYFEEKRYPLAGTQFDLAKERDPKDPTPWFYDAIQKQTQNRPVEALRDIQKSIELNDNRAVYRSKFLLDRDEAARGSSLARIFETLGFERRAVMETAKSLSFDPANHSAHRFLSDTYANTPRHEIARVSELLQAQMLQPINVNPVQPHMAVADLNIITNTGPSAIGFNEFAPLMERNKPQLVTSGVVGSNGALGDEVVASVLYDKASISMGQFHYETNGFRPNNDQKHNVYSAFMQYAVTPKFNIQAEIRTREKEHGDLLMDFNPKGDPFKRRELNENIARVGARYSLSPKQDFLLSGMYIDRLGKDFSRNDETPPFIVDQQNRLHVNGYQTEAQYLFRTDYFNIIAGAGFYQFQNKPEDKNNLSFLGQHETQSKNYPNFMAERNTGYIYTNLNFIRNMNWTLGVNYSAYDPNQGQVYDNNQKTGHLFKINEPSPKFGMQWNASTDVRLRFAWFKTVKSALIANQTLEPTQVAGFNQFFDDINGTRAQFTGGALDYRARHDVYTGIEISRRNLDVPRYAITEDSLISAKNDNYHNEKQKENLYRAYLYWLPHPRVAVRADVRFEDLKRNSTGLRINDPLRIETLSTPVSINYFDPSGFFAGLTGTYVRQNVRRNDAPGPENFFLLDSEIGFRLPKRRGILSFEGRNLLNDDFLYSNQFFYISEPVSSRYIPRRMFFAKLTFNF